MNISKKFEIVFICSVLVVLLFTMLVASVQGQPNLPDVLVTLISIKNLSFLIIVFVIIKLSFDLLRNEWSELGYKWILLAFVSYSLYAHWSALVITGILVGVFYIGDKWKIS